MTDNLYTGQDARDRLISGIRKAAAAVGATMGTGGSNSLIEALESPGHLTTNDGATILQSIRFADPIEEMGRKLVLEAVSRANKQSGDGSSTTTVLTAAIIEEGVKRLAESSPMGIKRALEACVPRIEEAVSGMKREITTDEVGKVAAVSAEDEAIGALIQEIYQQIGQDGIIYWDISKSIEDTYTIGQGLTVEGAGIASPYMFDRDKQSGALQSVAKLTNPSVLITREKITTGAVFEQLFSTLNRKGKKEVLIFCDDFEVQAIAHFVLTYQGQGFRTVLVKLPVLWGDEWRDDLAKASGATVLDPNAGLALKDAKEEHLGTFGHVVIDKDATYVDGIADLSLHVKQLEEAGTDEARNRAARLNTKTARLFVGAQSDSALSYKRLKVEDAISAAYQALHGGIVIGGGLALEEASKHLGTGIGADILAVALTAPKRQIEANLGTELDHATLEEQQVYDPANVVLNAAKNAISVAAAVLTANTVVTLPKTDMVTLPNGQVVTV